MKNYIPEFIATKTVSGDHTGSFKAFTMFVDLSGFTKLTRELMSHGSEGAEILSDLINRIFTPAIKDIDSNGGFISSFAGDAFTAIFPSSSYTNVLRSAFNMIEQISENKRFKTRFGEFSISVKVGLSYGNVSYNIIDTGVQILYYFKGKAINGCAAAEHQAEKMQIIADNDFIMVADKSISLYRIADNYFMIKTFSLPDHDLSISSKKDLCFSVEEKFIPASVLESDFKGEFREIVSLFIGFDENDIREEDIIYVVKKVHDFGGYFNKIDFGDKGGTMLVIFGAPAGREKLFIRAADFSLSLKGYSGIKFRIGITSGIAYCGQIGSEKRREYTALGNVVNLSARLMMTAEYGEILTDNNFNDHINNRYNIEFRANANLKGFNEEKKIYKLTGKKISYIENVRSNFFMGRGKEVSILKEFIEPVLKGRNAGILFVDGPAGIGKSCLIENFTKDTKECSVFTLQCDEILKGSFNPFIYLLKNYFNLQADLSMSEKEELFFEKLNDLSEKLKDNTLINELKRTGSVLAALIGINIKDSIFEKLDPKARYENIKHGLINFIKSLQSIKPSVFFLEDIHWIDSDSIDLLKELMEIAADLPFAMITTSRFNDDGSLFDPFIQGHTGFRIKRLELKGFTREMLHDMIFRLTQIKDLPERTSDLIWEKSGGNPFFIEQMTLYLMETGLTNEAFEIITNTNLLPTGIKNILISRIDRLSADIRNAVKTASVLGREFLFTVLEKMFEHRTGIKEENLMFSVKNAEKEQIWENLIEMNYVFRHALIRDAVYDIQLKSTLRELHMTAGKVIEKMFSDNISEHFEELADHFFKAEEFQKAAAYFQKAADRSVSLFQNVKAIELYDRLLNIPEISSTGIDINSVMIKKGEVLQHMGSWDESSKQFSIVLNSAENLGNYSLMVDCLNNIGYIKIIKGKADEAIGLFNKALSISAIEGYELGAANAEMYIGIALSDIGEYDEAVSHFQRKIAYCEKVNDNKSIREPLANLGNVYLYLGNYKDALECYTRDLEISTELGDKNGICRTVGNLGNLYYYQNELEKAREYYLRMLDISQETGDRYNYCSAAGNIGNVYAEMNDTDKGLKFYEIQYQISREIGDKRGEAAALGNMSHIFHDRGDIKLAFDQRMRHLSISREIGDRNSECVALYSLGDLYADLEDIPKAFKSYNESVEIGEDISARYYLSNIYFSKAALLYETGEFNEADKFNRKAMSIAEEMELDEIRLKTTVLDLKLKRDESGIKALLQKSENGLEETAVLNFDLWDITGNEIYRSEALELLRSINDDSPSSEYRRMISKMESSELEKKD